MAASSNSSARVIAVEASPENAEVLRENARINAHERIEVVASAFSDNNEPIRFQLTEASDNSGRGGHPSSPTVKVVDVESVTGVDLSIVSGRRLLIKLDVEGFELAALRGLEDVLAAASEARVLMEFNPKCTRPTGVAPAAVLDWLSIHGFRLFVIDETEFTWHEADIASIEEEVGEGYANIWCLPRESCITVSAVLHSAGLSGAERSHAEAVKDLVTLGCMVETIVPQPDLGLIGELKKSASGIRLVEKYDWWVDESSTDLFERHLASRPVYDAITHLNPDVVMTQTMTVPQGALAAMALGKPHLWEVCEFGDLDFGFVLPASPSEFGKLISALSDVAVTMSNAVKQHLFFDEDDSVHVLGPNPWMHQVDVVAKTRENERTIGVVASLHVGKGHADLIRAIAHATLREVPIRLKFFGSGSDFDRKRLRKLARELGVVDQIEFVGHLASRTDIYGSVDVVAVTSRSEAFGRIPFEATAAGRPVIYTSSGGIVEYMISGETGLSYAPGDVDELARNIVRLIDDESLQAQLVSQAARYFQLIFSEASLVGALKTHLAKAIEIHASRAKGTSILSPLFLRLAFALEAEVAATRGALAESQADRVAVRADRDALIGSRDSLSAELTRVAADFHEITVERNNAVVERDAVLNSRVWRFFQPYRNLRGIFRSRG